MTAEGSTRDPPPKDNPYVEDPDRAFAPVDELSEDEAAEQVRLLREAIDFHGHRYYVLADPVISDGAYDRLFHRLRDLEEAFDLTDPASPTQRVGGAPLDSLPTVEHEVEMLSLDASAEADEVREFDRRVREGLRKRAGQGTLDDFAGEGAADETDEDGDPVRYVAEPKFDGLSIQLVYLDGVLDRAVTRGDGRRGEEVTANVRTIRSLPLRLRGTGEREDPVPSKLVVRGEIFMPRPAFAELNKARVEAGEDPFANPRNAAAGTVRLLDPSVVAERPLDLFVFDVLACEPALAETHSEGLDLLRRLGFPVNDRIEDHDDIEGFIDYRDRLLADRDDLPYETDGAIAKVDDLAQRRTLGATARHPRWAFAYKFPPERETTTIRELGVQVGRTGKLTPVVLLDPVDILGVTVSRASLHNAAQARKLGARVGAKVRVERAGDVIPYVAEVVEGGADPDGPDAFRMPDVCPVCGSEVVQEGEYHFCTGGVSCPAQLEGLLEHFTARDALDIEGVGPETAKLLVEEGLVASVVDLYHLEKEDLVELEGFADRSAENLLDQIEASKEPELAALLRALGIRHVGGDISRRLAEAFPLDELMEATVEELEAVEGVGPIVAESVHAFFRSEEGRRTVEGLLEAGVRPTRERVRAGGAGAAGEGGGALEGKTFVFTGALEGWTRSEASELVERHGGRVTSSVSGNTDYVVVGEDPGSKADRARELGVEILDEEDFRALVEELGATG